MSNTEITIHSLGDAIKDKVRKTMMDAIPDEALQVLIKKEFDSFFVGQKPHVYSSEVSPSAFSVIVKKELELALSNKVKTIIEKSVQGLTHEWDEDGNKLIGDLVEKMAPAAMNGIMVNIASKCIMVLKNGTVY